MIRKLYPDITITTVEPLVVYIYGAVPSRVVNSRRSIAKLSLVVATGIEYTRVTRLFAVGVL